MSRKKNPNHSLSATDLHLEDGRRKLLPCQIERAKMLHDQSRMSYADMASTIFRGNISSQHLRMLCNPELYERQKQLAKKINGSKIYSPKTAEEVAKTRVKKKKIKETFYNNQAKIKF